MTSIVVGITFGQQSRLKMMVGAVFFLASLFFNPLVVGLKRNSRHSTTSHCRSHPTQTSVMFYFRREDDYHLCHRRERSWQRLHQVSKKGIIDDRSNTLEALDRLIALNIKYDVVARYDDDVQTVSSVPMFPAAPTVRRDSIIEKIAIFFLTWSLIGITTDPNAARKLMYPGMGYKQFVLVTRLILRGTAEDIKVKVVKVLLSLIPSFIRSFIAEFCQKNPRWISEKSSLFMSFGLLGWLVGKSERFKIVMPTADGGTEQWLSGVKLTECRYLVESGCKSACLHLCKAPTQAFFNEELNIQLHMKPNFTDCSCEMLFGVAPPAFEDDEAYNQACFSTCSMKELLFPNGNKGKVKARKDAADRGSDSDNGSRNTSSTTGLELNVSGSGSRGDDEAAPLLGNGESAKDPKFHKCS